MSLPEPYSSIRATVAILAARNETIDDHAAVVRRLGEVSHPRFKIRAQLLLATISAPAAAERLSQTVLATLAKLRFRDDERLQLLTSVVTGRTGPVLVRSVLTEAIRLASVTAVDHRRFIAWALSRSKTGFGCWPAVSSRRQAALLYSLISPLSTGLRWIRWASRFTSMTLGTPWSRLGTRRPMPWCGRAVL